MLVLLLVYIFPFRLPKYYKKNDLNIFYLEDIFTLDLDGLKSMLAEFKLGYDQLREKTNLGELMVWLEKNNVR